MYTASFRKCIEEAVAPRTAKAYKRDLEYFWAWAKDAKGCHDEIYPVPVPWVIGYTLEQMEGFSQERVIGMVAAGQQPTGRPLSIATVRRRLVSLSIEHTLREITNPTRHPGLAFLLRRVMRRDADRKRLRLPITADILLRLLSTCNDDLRGRRDRALLLVGYAGGGRRRSELAALAVENLEHAKGGYLARVPKHKTVGVTGQPLVFPIFDSAADALDQWLNVSGIREGRVFRGLDKHGNILPGISPRTVCRIVQRRAAAAALPHGLYSAHSLRSGFITQAARERIPLTETMAISGHRSIEVAWGYYRAGRIADNPAAHLSEVGRLSAVPEFPDNSLPTTASSDL